MWLPSLSAQQFSLRLLLLQKDVIILFLMYVLSINQGGE
jgi:hypothetical protein